VQEARPADANLIGLWEAEVGGGSLGELRHTGRVPMHEGRLQVDQVGERPRYLVEAGLGDPVPGLGLGLDDGDGCIGGGDLREQLATAAEERIGDGWIERGASPTACHLEGELRPAKPVEENRLARDLGEASRHGYVVAGQFSRVALAVPALVDLIQSALDHGTKAQPPGHMDGYLAVGARQFLVEPLSLADGRDHGAHTTEGLGAPSELE
jgi:hypothetical protein